MISTHVGLENSAEHLDNVRMPDPGELLPLDVELHLLGLGLEVLDGDLPRTLGGVMPHRPEHGPEAPLAEQRAPLNLIEADLLETVRGLLLDLFPIIVTIVW